MHSQDIYPNSNAAFRGDHVPMPVVRSMPTLTGGAGSHSSHDRSREHVYVNGKRYGIDAWRGDSPGRHCASVNVKHIALDTCWASDCLYEAANFYWNFDSIGRCVAHVNTGKDVRRLLKNIVHLIGLLSILFFPLFASPPFFVIHLDKPDILSWKRVKTLKRRTSLN